MPGSKTGFPGGLTLGPDQTNQAVLGPGKAASQVLRVSGNVVAAETITIGGDIYRIAQTATDTTKDLGDELAATTSFNNPRAKISMLAHGLRGGDLIRIDSEIMLVLQALNANEIFVQRAVCNTSLATHAAAASIFGEAAAGGGGIAVGLNATLTPTVATPVIAWCINNLGKERVVAYNPDVNTILVATADKPGGNPIAAPVATATTETMTNGAWDAATLAGGRANEIMQIVTIVPTAAQVTAGKIFLVFPFTPVIEDVQVRTTSTGAAVIWDGAITISGGLLTLDNAGGTDWAAASTITLFVRPS